MITNTKHWILLCLLCLLTSTIKAQDESTFQTMYNTAVSYYNNDDYENARRVFNDIKTVYGNKHGKIDIDNWLKKCNNTVNLSLSEKSISMYYDGNATNFTIVSTNAHKWTFTASEDWCTCKKSNDTLYISCSSNLTSDDRNCLITVKAGRKTERVNVYQQGINASLTIEPSILQFPSNASKHSVTIRTNIEDWDFKEVPTWCSAYKDDNILYVTCTKNKTTSDRNGMITITAANREVFLKVNQKNGDTIFYAEPREMTFNAIDTTKQITIVTNDPDWTYSENANWINIKKDHNILNVECLDNDSIFGRQALLKLRTETRTQTIVVSQLAKESHIQLSKYSIDMPSDTYSDTIILLKSKNAIEILSQNDWISTRRNDSMIVIRCNADNEVLRSGLVLIKSGADEIGVPVIQHGSGKMQESVLINSYPDELHVYIDGKLRGKTPLLCKYDNKIHTIEIGEEKNIQFFNESAPDIFYNIGLGYAQLTFAKGKRLGLRSGFIGPKRWGAYMHLQSDLDTSHMLTAGPSFEILPWMSVYLGAGLSTNHTDSTWKFGGNIGGGIMLYHKYLMLNLGIQSPMMFTKNNNPLEFTAGIGFFFKRFYDAQQGYCTSHSRLRWSLNFMFNTSMKSYGFMFNDIGNSRVRGYLKAMYMQQTADLKRFSASGGIVFTPVPSIIDVMIGGGPNIINTKDKNGFEAELGFVLNFWRFPFTVVFRKVGIASENTLTVVDLGVGFHFGDFKRRK